MRPAVSLSQRHCRSPWGANEFPHLLPGRSPMLGHEVVEARPELFQSQIDHRTTGIQQAQGIHLRLVGQTEVITEGLPLVGSMHPTLLVEQMSVRAASIADFILHVNC